MIPSFRYRSNSIVKRFSGSARHRETGRTPLERFAQARSVLRESPSSAALREAFRMEVRRRQRRSDGTISLEGKRFEIPSRYRHFRDVWVRYARWDLGRVDLVDPQQGTILAPLYPLDRQANADGQRLLFPLEGPREAAADQQQTEGQGAEHASSDGRPAREQVSPLLQQILAEYSATGIPPAYLPKRPAHDPGETS